ncbi:MAG: hypothetical protein JSW10_05960, partial [Pseudomonadota bacterium]
MLTLVTAGGITACASSAPVPEDTFYRLPDAVPAAAVAAPVTSGRLGVKRLATDGLHHERA